MGEKKKGPLRVEFDREINGFMLISLTKSMVNGSGTYAETVVSAIQSKAIAGKALFISPACN